ncbi:hypothetical protein LIX17_25155 (plasmid) [Mycobacterium avium subsp. hominissuis]|uniref:hypothetical protein n=1 Tax=Mycobacterium avium TaxID=1764 RepID=UPI0031407C34
MNTGAAPAFTVTLNADQITLFSLDEDAFDRWCVAKGDQLQCEVPKWTDPCAGTALSDLVHDAQQARVIQGDANFDLQVNGDDDAEVSGFYAVLRNAVGDQRLIGLTSGWTEVARVGDDTDARRGAREHLDEVCGVANAVLRTIGVAEPTPDSSHRHFGYWINRALRTARCYTCQYQFVGTDDTAQEWNPA